MPANNPLGYFSPEIQASLLGGAPGAGGGFGVQGNAMANLLAGGLRELESRRVQQQVAPTKFSDLDLTSMSRPALFELQSRARDNPNVNNAISREFQRRQLQGIKE